MNDAWTNPFAFTKNGEDRLKDDGCEVSDGDDSSSDQIVYREDHYQNLLGLYNRSDEVKPGSHLQHHFLKPEGQVFNDYLALAIPSDRETAVWGALQASELSFDEAFRDAANKVDQVESFNSRDCPVEDQSEYEDCSDRFSTHGLGNENVVADAYQQTETSCVEAVGDTETHIRDNWDHVDAKIDDIDEHVVGPFSDKLIKHKFKGTAKKKLNLTFRSMNNALNPQHDNGQVNKGGELSLAQKLQKLTDPSLSETKKQADAESLGSCSKVPMSVKLLHLVQNDASLDMNSKAKKNSDPLAMTNTNFCAKVAPFVERSKGESINDRFCKALLEAPPISSEEWNRQGRVQGTVSGFAARLQKLLDRERNARAEFSWLQTRHDLIGQLSYLDVEILSKSLEARLSVCECNIVKCSEANKVDPTSFSKLVVIFSMQANSLLELECGTVIRLYPPWYKTTVKSLDKHN